MRQFGVGVIGAGWAGWRYAHVWGGLPDVTVRVVCDVREDAARKLAGEVGAEWCTDFEDVMRRSDVDAVGICTPDSSHLAPCLSAARAGKHILVEKPLATDLGEAERIVEVAGQSKVTLMVGHLLRFDPRWYGARTAISSGEIGDVLTIYTRRNVPASVQERLGGRVSLQMFLGVHDYDAMRWLVGAEVTRVYAQSRFGFWTGRGYQVEDATCAVLNFANGAIGVSELSWVLAAGEPASDWRVDVTGDRGSVHIANAPDLVRTDERRSAILDVAFTPVMRGLVVGDFLNELRHFVDCLARGGRPEVTGEDGLEAVRIALAVEESARTGRPVEMEAVAAGRRRG